MPVVTIEQSPRDESTKRKAIQAITNAIVESYGVSPDQVTIFIHEVDDKNWGNAGKLAVDM